MCAHGSLRGGRTSLWCSIQALGVGSAFLDFIGSNTPLQKKGNKLLLVHNLQCPSPPCSARAVQGIMGAWREPTRRKRDKGKKKNQQFSRESHSALCPNATPFLSPHPHSASNSLSLPHSAWFTHLCKMNRGAEWRHILPSRLISYLRPSAGRRLREQSS